MKTMPDFRKPEGDHDAALKLAKVEWSLSEDKKYYEARIDYCGDNNIPASLRAKYQYLKIYVPADYISEDGCSYTDNSIGGYTARTAPVIFKNNCFGWRSSIPKDANEDWLSSGWIQVECGARSRDCDENSVYSKSPSQIVDLKSGLRMLRLNSDKLPGNYDHVISYGFSGGGQMSSMLGATGNMPAYFELLWENGSAGIAKKADGTFVSTIDDSVFGCMCFAPIATLQAASVALAWMRFDSSIDGKYALTPFQKQLEKDMAVRFCEYINSLNLKDSEGEVLSFDIDPETGKPDPRRGNYYKQTLKNMSDALNCFADNADTIFPYTVRIGLRDTARYYEYPTLDDLLTKYHSDGDSFTSNGSDHWFEQRPDGTYSVTDFAGFFHGTGLKRFKNVPAFDGWFLNEETGRYTDGYGKDTENNAFGRSGQIAVHYSPMVAELLNDNYDKYSQLEGFDAKSADRFIREASDEYLIKQLYLMDSMQIMLNKSRGEETTNVAEHWRVRMGTADQNSFAIAYNFCMAARMAGADVDYHLVWAMPHSEDEGISTGTFADWVDRICK